MNSRSVTTIRVLVVDDSALQRTILEYQLRLMGFSRIVQAEDGVRALKRLGRFKPHVVITDCPMHGVDGCELVSRLRASPKTKDVPVIVSTAETREDGFWKNAGFSACLSKPVRGEDLQARLKDVLPGVRFAKLSRKKMAERPMIEVLEQEFLRERALMKDLEDYLGQDLKTFLRKSATKACY